MSDSAGARIAMGLGIIALVVVIAFILEQVAGTEQATPGATPEGEVPTEIQFCVAWTSLRSSAADRADRETENSGDTREALDRVRELGIPTSMPQEAHAGLLAALDRIEGELDPDFAPTAYPAEPDEDAAFSSYLEVNCPS